MPAELHWQGDLVLDDRSRVSLDLLAEEDLEAMLRIERRSHPSPWRREHFLSSLNASHHYCLGARHGEEVIGYAVTSCAAGEAELLLLVTDIEWQGRGLATALLGRLFRVMSNVADTLFLEVRASNQRAIQLYEKMAFNQVGVRPGYYPSDGGREDALVYARALLSD